MSVSLAPTAPPDPHPDGHHPDLRSAFRRSAASTWVVTGAASPERAPVGFTAVSVVSVSLDPPLVSFNIARASSSLATLGRSRRAALHLLGGDQTHLAARFAGDRGRRFDDDGTWGWADGLPAVHGTTLRLVTDLVDLVDAGDSLLALARVRRAVPGPGAAPLVHHSGHFVALSPIGA